MADNSEQKPLPSPSATTTTEMESAVDAAVTAVAAAVAASQPFATEGFTQSTADVVRALTTSLEETVAASVSQQEKLQKEKEEQELLQQQQQQQDQEEATAAAAVAAVAAAAQLESDHAQSTSSPAPEKVAAEPTTEVDNAAVQASLDVAAVLSQVGLLPSHLKSTGRRTEQEAFEQSQAARALQQIALSLNNPSSQTAVSEARGDGGVVAKEELTLASVIEQAQLNSQHEQLLNTVAQPPSSATANAASTLASALADDRAFASAVFHATQAAEASNLDAAGLGSSSSNSASNGATSSNEGFTFEVDKATGKTQVKWTADPKQETNNAFDADTLSRAALDSQTLAQFQALIANGMALGTSAVPLLAPALGTFPAQGSQFGTAQDSPPNPEPPRKRRNTSTKHNGSAGGNPAMIPEGATSYPCTFENCDKVFARLYNLKSHSRTHTNDRPFVCSHCSQAFSRNHDLKRHIKIHGGDKPFKCNGCGKAFSRLDALGRHRGNSKNRAGCQVDGA